MSRCKVVDNMRAIRAKALYNLQEYALQLNDPELNEIASQIIRVFQDTPDRKIIEMVKASKVPVGHPDILYQADRGTYALAIGYNNYHITNSEYRVQLPQNGYYDPEEEVLIPTRSEF